MASYELPELPYAYDALEPHIDEESINIDHTEHHNTYIKKLNDGRERHADLESRLLEDPASKLEAVPEDNRTAVRNIGGGHANHSLFSKVMSAIGGSESNGELADKIISTFAS